MKIQLCAISERVERFVARPQSGLAAVASRSAVQAVLPTQAVPMFGFSTDATTATNAWNVKPTVHTTAIRTLGKYHVPRLQEMHT